MAENKFRYNADRLMRTKLKPAAEATDPYVQAGGVDPSQGTRQLAKSLARVQPSLARLVAKEEVRREREAENEVQSRMAQMEAGEVLQARKRGDFDKTSDRFEREALDVGFGQRLARQRELEFGQRLAGHSTAGEGMPSNAIDPLSQDVDQIIADQIETDFEEFGLDPKSSGAALYVQQMERARGKLLSAQAKAQVEETKLEKLDTAFSATNQVIEDGLAQGLPPEEIANLVDREYQDSRILYNLTPNELNDYRLKVADDLAAAGKYELVEALLTGRREKRGGGTIAGMALTGRYADQSNKILAKARTQAAKNLSDEQFDATVHFFDQARQGKLFEDQLQNWRKANPHRINDNQARSLIVRSLAVRDHARQQVKNAQVVADYTQQAQQHNGATDAELLESLNDGILLSIGQIDLKSVTKSGQPKTTTLTDNKLLDHARDRYLNEFSPRIAKARQETPEQTLIREVEVLAKNGLDYPRLKRVLNAGPASLSVRSVTSAEDLPPAVLEGYQQYRQLKTLNPRYLRNHVSDKRTEEFYESMLAAQEYLGAVDEQQAALTAYNALYGEAAVNTDLASKDIDTAVSDLRSSKESWFKFGDNPVRNTGILEARIRDKALTFRRLGLPADEAVERASEVVEPTFMEINGWAVPLGGTLVPEGFKDTVQNRLEQVASDLDLDVEDLAVSPIGGTRNIWSVVYGATGLPVPSNAKTVFSTESLFRQHTLAKEKARQKLTITTADEFNANKQRRKEVVDKVLTSEGSNAL